MVLRVFGAVSHFDGRRAALAWVGRDGALREASTLEAELGAIAYVDLGDGIVDAVTRRFGMVGPDVVWRDAGNGIGAAFAEDFGSTDCPTEAAFARAKAEMLDAPAPDLSNVVRLVPRRR